MQEGGGVDGQVALVVAVFGPDADVEDGYGRERFVLASRWWRGKRMLFSAGECKEDGEEQKMQKASHYRWDQTTGGDSGATTMVVDGDDADDCDN